GRAATPFSAGLGHLIDFALHQQGNIARHLSERTGEHSASTDQRRQPIASTVPRRAWQTKIKFPRQRRRHAKTIFTESHERATRTAELKHQSVIKRVLQVFPAVPNRS